jgi:G3E family GTPase
MFLAAQQHQARLPVLILTGFLGSGKTTLVNRLLRDARLAGTAVAVNEFGEVPLDAHLIEHNAEQTIVMANGCLCCNVLGDMEDAVMRIFSRSQSGSLPSFERLIIEPSGLADPAPIAQAILRNPVLASAFRLEGIIATVDCVFFARQLAAHPETHKQIAMADRLVITKSDMAGPADLQTLLKDLRALNPLADILTAVNGEIDPAALLPAGFLDPALAAPPRRAAFTADTPADHTSDTVAISLSSEIPLEWKSFELWLRKIRLANADSILRFKAILNLAGNEAPVVLHGVHHVLHAPVQFAAWPDDDRRSRLVFITRGLKPGIIETAWAQSAPGFTTAIAA